VAGQPPSRADPPGVELRSEARGGLPDELEPLVRGLDALLGRLRAAFDRERSLAANASHELRPPLAALPAAIDAALQGERGDDDYRARLVALQGTVERLARMVERLPSNTTQTRLATSGTGASESSGSGRSTWRTSRSAGGGGGGGT